MHTAQEQGKQNEMGERSDPCTGNYCFGFEFTQVSPCLKKAFVSMRCVLRTGVKNGAPGHSWLDHVEVMQALVGKGQAWNPFISFPAI